MNICDNRQPIGRILRNADYNWDSLIWRECVWSLIWKGFALPSEIALEKQEECTGNVKWDLKRCTTATRPSTDPW